MEVKFPWFLTYLGLVLWDSEDLEGPEDFGEIDGFRRFRRIYWKYQWIEVFQHSSAEVMRIEPTLRSTQVLKLEAEDIGLQGKDIAKYVTRQHTLDREERAAWRVAQKFYAEEKKRADEIRLAEIQAEKDKRAQEIRLASDSGCETPSQDRG